MKMGFIPKTAEISKFFNKRSVKYGVPFLLLMLGGSFGLKEFTHLRYQFRKVSSFSYKDVEEMGIEMKKPGEVTLESEYEKIKNLDIDNWVQIRGPRPWEEKDEST